MSPITLRFSPTENVLRSTGDRPNGTVGVAIPDDQPTLTVDSAYEPGHGSRLSLSEVGIDPTSTPITVEEAVEGCADEDALRALVAATLKAVTAASGYALGHYAFGQARRWIDLAEDVADAATARLEREARRREEG